jgi:capsular polysaccharide biosynthesis protein
MVKDKLSNLTLIYPESWKSLVFVNETLDLFPELKIKVIPDGEHLFVKKLIMPEVKPWTPMFIPEQVFAVRNLLFDALKKKNKVSPFGKNIYISRKAAKRRKFTNEDKVEELLSKFGFESVLMENYTFFEQIAIMNNADNITALTGAGLINLMFKKEGGSFLDLTNKEYIHKSQYKFHFYKLCNILNIKYGVAFFEHENSPLADHYSNQNLLVDENLISKNLNLLLKNDR